MTVGGRGWSEIAAEGEGSGRGWGGEEVGEELGALGGGLDDGGVQIARGGSEGDRRILALARFLDVIEGLAFFLLMFGRLLLCFFIDEVLG